MTDGEYIGDGVYAGFDGYGVWLKTVRDGVEHCIYLDPVMVDRLKSRMEFGVAPLQSSFVVQDENGATVNPMADLAAMCSQDNDD